MTEQVDTPQPSTAEIPEQVPPPPVPPKKPLSVAVIILLAIFTAGIGVPIYLLVKGRTSAAAIVAVIVCTLLVVGSLSDSSSSSDSYDSGVSIDTVERDSGSGEGGEEYASSEPAEEPPVDDTEQTKEQPVIAISAKELITSFEDNELVADKRFSGRRLKVTGFVEKVDTDLLNENEYILMINNGGDFELLSVSCRDMSQDVLSTLKTGASVTVIGDFDDGGDLGVELNNCKLARR
jgi:hypothetical protein